MPQDRSRFYSSRAALWTAAIVLLAVPGPAVAAGHPDITVMSLGGTSIKKGAMDRVFRLPSSVSGTLDQCLVLMAAQPLVPVNQPGPLDPASAPAEEKEKKQVPATLKFTIAGKDLPPWVLEPYATAYVINLGTIRSNPQYAQGNLALKADLETEAPNVSVVAYGMPDPRLAADNVDGPLSALIQTAVDPDLKSYFQAMADELAGRKEQARAAYEKLSRTNNAAVARFARRGARLLAYEFRPHKLSGNYNEHYRWALYLQQCGLYGQAAVEFNDCRMIYPDVPEAHYFAGENKDRLGAAATKVLQHMQDAAVSGAVADGSDWYALVVILESRGGQKLRREEIDEVKNQFMIMQGMVWGATGGVVRIIPSFMIVADESEWSYTLRDKSVIGPSDQIVARRGWFDAVYSIFPRLPDDPQMEVATVGGDLGPNGAALSNVPSNARWTHFLEAFYQQFIWAAQVGEIGAAYPDIDQALYAGHQPTPPNRAFAYRAALVEGFTPAMHRRAKIADTPQPDSFIRIWKIEGPYPVNDAPSPDKAPKHHVLDPLPSSVVSKPIRLDADTDFIDLTKLYPAAAGWALAQATTWVFSPVDQELRMWLGQNDGLAVWLNGRCIHEGRYYAAHNYEDRNLVDTVASYARLKKGWNHLQLVVESWPAPRNKGWGFSVRFCRWNNEPPVGLAYLFDAPAEDLAPQEVLQKPETYFDWETVKRDYLDSIPRLSASDLAAITGISNATFSSDTQGPDGFFALSVPDRPDAPTYRSLRTPWRAGKDLDVTLNNVMDWAREDCVVLHYMKAGQERDLLVVKPKALSAFTTLLEEPPAAKGIFKDLPPSKRILGYILVPTGSCSAPLIVFDALLGEEKTWPADEEGLLHPILPVYVPNKNIPPPPPIKPAS